MTENPSEQFYPNLHIDLLIKVKLFQSYVKHFDEKTMRGKRFPSKDGGCFENLIDSRSAWHGKIPRRLY